MSTDLLNYYEEVVSKVFKDGVRRPFLRKIIEEVGDNWEAKNVFIIEAPTGYGKTSISLTVARYSVEEELKVVVAYPLRSLLEDQVGKFRRVFGNLVGVRYMHHAESRYFVKPVTLTTVDTLALTLFGIAPEDLSRVSRKYHLSGTSTGSLGHYMFSWASVGLSNVVLDEAHLLADSTKSINFLVALARLAVESDFKLVMMSATLPEAFLKAVREGLREYGSKLHVIKFAQESSDPFVSERLRKKYRTITERLSREVTSSRIKEYLRKYGCGEGLTKALVVFNTVREATEFYRELTGDKEILECFGGRDRTLLLHSRFTEKDRGVKINKLKELERSGKYLVVTTQVIEAGVDLTSNLMITDACPANSLIQRVGRFLRREGEDNGVLVVWFSEDSRQEARSYKVYDLRLTNETFSKLRNLGSSVNLHLPEGVESRKGYNELLSIYSPSDFSFDEEGVQALAKIQEYLERGSEKALEEFYRLEGSFVRDSALVAVVPSEECVDDLKTLMEKAVPVGLGTLVSLIKRGLITGAISEDIKDVREEGAEVLKCGGADEIKYLLDKLSRAWISAGEVVRELTRRSILAFMVKASYDSELGLEVGDQG